MKFHTILALTITCAISILSLGLIKESSAENSIKADEKAIQKVNFLVDFTDYQTGSVDKWLKSKGFVFERDARNRKKLDLDISEGGLVLEAKTQLNAVMLNDAVNLEKVSHVRIEWGVIKYPKGASYAKKVNNAAIMVIFFFGHDRLSSGHFLIPNSPYFVGLFLCETEQVNKGFKGRYFQKGGRYVCLDNPKPGETVISEYNLVSAFKRKYKQDEVPVISGIALAVDTSKSGDNGKATAFIKNIKFLD